MIFGRNPERSREDSIDALDATSARVKLDMSVGSLRLAGGATSLMDARFEFNEGTEPRVDYTCRNGRGELRVDQPGLLRSMKVTRNRWDIRLNDTLPIDLEIENGAGEADLDASTLSLTSVELEQAAGDCTILLNGNQQHLSYVDADIAAGRLDLVMCGDYPAMRELRAESAAGQLKLDLTGTWHTDVDIKVEVTAGEAVIRLPSTVNIRARANTTVGRVKTRGLVVDGDRFTHTASGATALMKIKISATVGQVVLELVD